MEILQPSAEVKDARAVLYRLPERNDQRDNGEVYMQGYLPALEQVLKEE